MSTARQYPRYLPAGDKALSVEFGDSISAEVNRRVHELAAALRAQPIPGIVEAVPTYRSLLVYYEPLVMPYAGLVDRLQAMSGAREATEAGAGRVVEVPTAYGGEFGPDLAAVARHNGLTEAEVVQIHSGTDYLVYMMGFTPGFPYLGGMSPRIATPRLQTPRPAVPAGSVAIAERQTGVYPIESPGGWQLIGRTPVQLFDPTRDPPVLVEPGDYIRFVLIDTSEYAVIEQHIRAGAFELTTHPASERR